MHAVNLASIRMPIPPTYCGPATSLAGQTQQWQHITCCQDNLRQIKLPDSHQTGQEQGSRTCGTPPNGPPSMLPPPPFRRRLLTRDSPSCSAYMYNMHTTQLSNLLLEGACWELISNTHLPTQTHGMPTRNLAITCRYAQHSLQLCLE